MKIPTRSRGMNTERLLQQSLVLISNYVAYYKILVNVYCKGFGHFPLVLLSGMFFFAIAWILVAKGFRHWQENWDVLSKGCTGEPPP